MLIEKTLFGEINKIQIAIDRIRQFEPEEGYYVAFSGGKDSQVVEDLCKMAGVKYDAHNNHTSVDPPELVYFIREHYKHVEVHMPKKTMWQLISTKGVPTRVVRYCCSIIKECGGRGRLVMTGVRWDESVRRSNRKMVEQCYNDNSKRYFHPIIDWTSEDVWEYIHLRKLPYCTLYDEGFKRLGCIMCPLAGKEQMLKEADRFPTYAKMYRFCCQKAVDYKKSKGNKCNFKNGDEMYDWWIEGKSQEKVDPDQTVFFLE